MMMMMMMMMENPQDVKKDGEDVWRRRDSNQSFYPGWRRDEKMIRYKFCGINVCHEGEMHAL